MLLRNFFFAYLLLPSYASWYPNAKVSCDTDYEKENQPLVPSKTLKVELQGYQNIILLGICGLTVLIYLTYTLKSHHPNLLVGLLNGYSHRQNQMSITEMSKTDKDGPQDKASFQDDKVNQEELAPQPPPEIVPPPLPPNQIGSDITPCEEARPEDIPLNDDEPGEITWNSECEASGPDTSEICPTVEDDMSNSETIPEMPRLELSTSSTRKEIEPSHKPLENSKRTRSTECTTPKNNSATTKCKIPDSKSSPTKGNSGTKLPQKLSKNSLASPKSAGRTTDAIPSSSRAGKPPTESLLRRQAKRESNDSVSKDALTTDAHCRCDSKVSIDKLTKEIEALKRRITTAEKGKREAIRDGDILQKGMTSIKLSLKSMTEENAKLKKELEIAKRDKTESVRRITAKWREKLGQLEEKMRMEAECASNKAESIISNVASNSSKNRPEPEDCPMKPTPHSSRLYRWSYKPEPQEACKRRETTPSSYCSNEGEITLGWVDEVIRKGATEGVTDEAQHIPSADLPVRNNQELGGEVPDYVTTKSAANAIPEVMTDDHPREDDWLEDDAYLTGNGDNDPVLQDIISEATARLDDLRSTDVLDDQGTELEYQESSIPASEVGAYVETSSDEVAREAGMATHEKNEESLTSAEDSIITQASGIEEPLSTSEFNSPAASSVNSKERSKVSSGTEIGHKGGRFLTLRAKSKDSNTSVEISIAGKKNYNVEALRTGQESVKSYSKSNVSIGKNGLAPKTSEKVCTTKPPVPKSTLHRATSKNEFDLRSMDASTESSHSIKMTRTTSRGSSAHHMIADHSQDISTASKYSSYTKVLDSTAAEDSEGKGLMSNETSSDNVHEIEESYPNTLSNESEDTAQENQANEKAVTEILHPSSNYWTTFEEENRCNVIDETCHRYQENAEDTQLNVIDVPYDSEQGLTESGGGVTQEIVPDEMTGEMTSINAEEAEIQAAMNSMNLNIPGQSISDMELEARKYIQDLIALSSTFSEEEKEAVEELLGGNISGRSLLQNLTTMVSLDAEVPNESAAPDTGSNDSGHIPANSETCTGQSSSTAPGVGSSTSADSVTSLGQGFLTGKLKQCFVYDPQRLKDQNTDALKNFMQMVVAKKADGNNNTS